MPRSPGVRVLRRADPWRRPVNLVRVRRHGQAGLLLLGVQQGKLYDLLDYDDLDEAELLAVREQIAVLSKPTTR